MHPLLCQDEIQYRDFSGYIAEASKRFRANHRSSQNMYDGDMWDHGRGYIGPIPIEGDSHYSNILFNIKRTFVGRNVIAEVVDRAVDSLLSKSPDWKIYDKAAILAGETTKTSTVDPENSTPTEIADEATAESEDLISNPKITEAEMLLSEVWNRAKLGDNLKESLTRRMITGRGILRVYLEKRFFEKQSKVTTFYDVAKFIKVECVDNEKAQMLNDGGDKLSIIQITNKQTKKKTIELSFIDEADNTVVATINSSNTADQSATNEEVDQIIQNLAKVADLSSQMSLQQELTADEILGKPFVTETMLQNNRALNLSLSLGVGVLIESGYAEMVMTNVSMETRTETDPTDSNKTIQVPVGLKRGPGVVNNLIGEQTVDAEGTIKYEKPDVHFKEPSKIDSFSHAESWFYRQILSEAKQIHILIVGDAKASGEARIQARQDFVKKSQRYKPSLDVHGTWLLNTIMNLAASAIDKDGYFEDLSVLFDSKVYAGELSADEQNVVISRFEKGLISRESAITLLGSEEPLIEIAKIKQDDAAKLAKQLTTLEATAQFGNMNANGAPSTSGQTARPNTVAGSAGSNPSGTK